MLKVFSFHSVETALLTQTAQSWSVLLSVNHIFFTYEAARAVNCNFEVVWNALKLYELFSKHVFRLHFFAKHFSQRDRCLVLWRWQGSLLLELTLNHDVNRIRNVPLLVYYLVANALMFLHKVDKLLYRSPLHANKARYNRQKLEQLVRSSLLNLIEWSVKVAFVQHAISYLCLTFDGGVASVVWVDQRQLAEGLTLTKHWDLVIVHSVVEVKVAFIYAKWMVWHITIQEQIV